MIGLALTLKTNNIKSMAVLYPRIVRDNSGNYVKDENKNFIIKR